MRASECLRMARAKISKPENWTQLVAARDAHGNFVEAESPDAVAWCWNGSLLAVTSDMDMLGRASEFTTLAANTAGYECCVSLNDNAKTTHADVLAAFDEAIASAERAEAADG
jgi:hypothetical protein